MHSVCLDNPSGFIARSIQSYGVTSYISKTNFTNSNFPPKPSLTFLQKVSPLSLIVRGYNSADANFFLSLCLIFTIISDRSYVWTINDAKTSQKSARNLLQLVFDIMTGISSPNRKQPEKLLR